MADAQWSIRGEYMESCNCDYLCPCVYTNPQGPVTYDHCTAVLVFRIDEGDFSGMPLADCKFAFVLRSGKVMADGNWIFAVVVEGVASRNRSGEPYYIDNTAHPANRRLALARSSDLHVHGFGLDLDMAGQGN